MHEDAIVAEYSDENTEHECKVCAGQSERCGICHMLTTHVLCASGMHEADMAYEDGNPCQQAKQRDQTNEVAKHDP